MAPRGPADLLGFIGWHFNHIQYSLAEAGGSFGGGEDTLTIVEEHLFRGKLCALVAGKTGRAEPSRANSVCNNASLQRHLIFEFAARAHGCLIYCHIAHAACHIHLLLMFMPLGA